MLMLMMGCKKKSETSSPKLTENETLTADYGKLGISFLARLYPQYWETFPGANTVVDIKNVGGTPYLFYFDEHVSLPKNIVLNKYGKLENHQFVKFTYEGCGVGTEKVKFQLNHTGDLMHHYFDYPNYYLCNSKGVFANTTTDFKWIDELSGNLYSLDWRLYNGYTAFRPLLYAYQNNAKWTLLDSVPESLPTQSFAVNLSPKGNIYLAYTVHPNLSVAADGYMVLQGYDGSVWNYLGKMPAKNINDIALSFNRPNPIRIIPNGEKPFILITRTDGISVFRYNAGILEKISDNVPMPFDPKDHPFCVYNDDLYTFHVGANWNTDPIDGQTLYKLNGSQFELYRKLNVQPSGGGTYAIRNIFGSNGRMFICTELMINSNVITDIIELK